MNIGVPISQIKKLLPEGTKLVAVSKTKPPKLILEAYKSEHKIFDENKVQELVRKFEVLPDDIEWHFIGHLQSNKVKYIAPFISFIHGIDSFKLLKVVNKEAAKNNRVIPCLLQFHIAKEPEKYGLELEEARDFLSSPTFRALENVQISGVMGMATFTDDSVQIRNEFKSLVSIFNLLKNEFFLNHPDFKELSMGMSDDFPIAV